MCPQNAFLHNVSLILKTCPTSHVRCVQRGRSQQVREVAVHGVQESLAGLLALHPRDLEEPVQLVLGLRDGFNHVQLLGVQDVKHVVKYWLQVAGIQADLTQHGVFLFFGNKRSCSAESGGAAGSRITA